MGYLGQGVDSQGRHVISYSSGDHTPNDSKRFYDDIQKGPISIVNSYTGIIETSPPLRALIRSYNDSGWPQLQNGTNKSYPLRGELYNTRGNAIPYLDGVAMDEREYTIDFFNKEIVIHRCITFDNDEIDFRSEPDSRSFYIFKNLLVLPVNDVITEADLPLYAPEFGDKINIKRVRTYKENQRQAITNIIDSILFEDDGYVMEYQLKPDGIYATLKLIPRK